jgi:lysophospholipase L1-like esterase
MLSSSCDAADAVVYCHHSASGLQFYFEGETLRVTLAQGRLLYQNDPRLLPRVAFYVNGERVIDDLLDVPQKTYTLTTQGRVEIVKLSEGHMSGLVIQAIETDGTVTPVPQRDKLIEFIGDSITVGYGVDASRDDSFSTATQDVTKAYAYKAAQALNADLRIQAVSGAGVVSGSTATGEKQPDHVMPLYYDWESSQNQARPPDLIVINLGTNDASYTRRQPAREAEFTQAYADFLQRLRDLYPNAAIICALGIMGDDLYEAMAQAVVLFDDKNTSLLRFDTQRPEDGYGADWHPSEATHDKAARRLVDFIIGAE